MQPELFDVVLHNKSVWVITAAGRDFAGLTFDPSVEDLRHADSVGPFYLLQRVGAPESILVDSAFMDKATLMGRAAHMRNLCNCPECGELPSLLRR